jgi:hypothetical protein
MHLHSVLSLLFRRALLGLLCASTLVACEPGNDLKKFSGRQLRLTMVSHQGDFWALLEQHRPEAGCLQLHPGVEATFDGVPLDVNPGGRIVDPDRCLNAPPLLSTKLDIEQFFGEPRNAVLEIRDGDQRITAEFTNYFARHAFALIDPPPAVRPGQEIVVPWDPPTDDISRLKEVSLNGRAVPATPEGSSVRFTVPADFPTGLTTLYWIFEIGAENIIPAARCEGVALCTANTWPLGLPTRLDIQP